MMIKLTILIISVLSFQTYASQVCIGKVLNDALSLNTKCKAHGYTSQPSVTGSTIGDNDDQSEQVEQVESEKPEQIEKAEQTETEKPIQSEKVEQVEQDEPEKAEKPSVTGSTVAPNEETDESSTTDSTTEENEVE